MTKTEPSTPSHLSSVDRRAFTNSSSSTKDTPSKDVPRINFVVNTQKLLDEANRKIAAMQHTIDSQQHQLQSQQRQLQRLQHEKASGLSASNAERAESSHLKEERDIRTSQHILHQSPAFNLSPWAVDASPMGNAASSAMALLSYHEKNLSKQNNFALSNSFLEKLTLNRMKIPLLCGCLTSRYLAENISSIVCAQDKNYALVMR